MRIEATRSFVRDHARLPQTVRQQVAKQLVLLVSDPRHPSLRLKRMQGSGLLWEARINRSYRMTLQIVADAYILRRVRTHDILNQP